MGDPADATVVCLHGVNAHGLRFRRLAERLPGRRVVALDLRGHGHSGWEPPWDLATHVDDVLETADSLGVDRADWIGHSFGGRLVIELAARVPERVSRAVLLDPAVWVPPPVALERAEEQREALSFATVAEAIEWRRSLSALAPVELIEEEMDAHLVESDDGRFRTRFSPSAVVAAYGEMAKPPPLRGLTEVPTLIVRAPGADVCPDAIVEVCRDSIPGVEVVDVPGGHIVMWDAFDETAEAVARFLA
ncbi:MAG: alpha/beta hydrolase [Gaiellaceae bacterium]